MPNRRNTIPIGVGLGVLLVVATVVGLAVWRTMGDDAQAQPTLTDSPGVELPTRSAEQVATDSALAAYNGFREAYVAAATTSDAANADLPKYAIDPALAEAKLNLYTMNREGLISTGRPTWNAQATSVNLTAKPNTVELKDCLDINNSHIVRRADNKPADAPGQARRFVVTAKATLTDDGRWVIREVTADRKTSC